MLIEKLAECGVTVEVNPGLQAPAAEERQRWQFAVSTIMGVPSPREQQADRILDHRANRAALISSNLPNLAVDVIAQGQGCSHICILASLDSIKMQAAGLWLVSGRVGWLKNVPTASVRPGEFAIQPNRYSVQPMFGAVQDLVMLALWVVTLGVKAFAFIDCVRRRPDAFPAVGRQTKVLWLILTGLAALTGVLPQLTLSIFGIAGIVIALIYLFDIRPRIIDITRR